ncbi:MAG: hydrolase, partial [bacterium]|nr:hydrolase [bacterium]
MWAAETHRDGAGWYVEMRIPFSSIRYRSAESMTWGLLVARRMHGRGRSLTWVNWPREQEGFVSRFGTLTGLEGIRPPRQLEIMPYLVGRTTDPAASGPDDDWNDFENAGVDIKYGVTADLTMNATIQPDFGQVEADPAVLNLSPYETWYQEKRPFFIEGSRFLYHPTFDLFYTRRIGTGSENSRIRFAGKLVGKVAGDFSVAGLLAATDETATGQAHNILKGGQDR